MFLPHIWYKPFPEQWLFMFATMPTMSGRRVAVDNKVFDFSFLDEFTELIFNKKNYPWKVGFLCMQSYL